MKKSTLFRAGATAVLIGSALHFVHPATTLGTDVKDGVLGLMIGLAIGCFGFAVSRREPSDCGVA